MQSVDNELLHRLINELPDLSREIVVMHLFHNVNLITVSKVMKLNYQTVRSRYRRALITIKERMEEIENEARRAKKDRGSDQVVK